MEKFINHIKNKTEDYQATPPDFIWSNIENHLQNYPITINHKKPATLIKIGVVSIIFLILFSFVYFFNTINFNNHGNLTAYKVRETKFFIFNSDKLKNIFSNKQIAAVEVNNKVLIEKKPILITIKTEEVRKNIAQTNNTTLIKTNSNPEKTNQEIVNVTNETSSINHNIPTQERRKQYVLNTQSFKDIKSVRFVNSHGKEILKIDAPSVNLQKFWNIDVSALPYGTYQIKIETASKIINYKQITFNE